MILTLWLPGLAATRWYRAATPQKRTPNPSSVVLLEDHVSFKISDEVMIWCYGLWSKNDVWSSTSGWPNMIWFLSYSSVIFPGLSISMASHIIFPCGSLADGGILQVTWPTSRCEISRAFGNWPTPLIFFATSSFYQHWSQSNVFCESQRVKGLWSSCHVVGPCRSYLPSIYEDLHIHKAAPSSPWEHEGPKVKRIFQHLSLPRPTLTNKSLRFFLHFFGRHKLGSLKHPIQTMHYYKGNTSQNYYIFASTLIPQPKKNRFALHHQQKLATFVNFFFAPFFLM